MSFFCQIYHLTRKWNWIRC